MTIKELVLSVQNRPGELAHIVGRLRENDVTVPAFWVGAEKKKSTFRFIASDPETAISVLTGLGFKVTTVDVIAAQVPDHPGGLNTILRALQSEEINILHIYPCLGSQVLILEVDRTEDAVKVFENNWIKLYDKTLYDL